MQQTKILRLLRAILWRGQRVVNRLKNKLIRARDAREVNRALFANITQLDTSEVEKNIKRIRELCAKRGYDKGAQDFWETHVYRIMLTKKWIDEISQSLPETAKAMDLGEESVTSDYWRLKFPKIQWSNTDWDLRNPC